LATSFRLQQNGVQQLACINSWLYSQLLRNPVMNNTLGRQSVVKRNKEHDRPSHHYNYKASCRASE